MKKLEKRLAAASENSARGMRRLLNTLRREHDLLAELMAVCARPGPAEDDSGFEYIAQTEDPSVHDFWAHSGSQLGATHHLPEPAAPPAPSARKDAEGGGLAS